MLCCLTNKKLKKVREEGRTKNEKELDIIKMLHLMRNLKEFVKNIDDGDRWRETKKKAKYLSKYVINIETDCVNNYDPNRRQSTINTS